MPPPNAERRDMIADAAIEVLAREGSRGLTHRAVDSSAEVPPGTASRYFRTRDALLNGIVDRLTGRINDRVAACTVRPVARDGLADVLTSVLSDLLTVDRRTPLALAELHLESTRNRRLRELLAAALAERKDLIVRQCRAAGVALTDQDALLLEMTVLGIVFTTLTVTPEAFGQLAALTRTAVAGVLSRYE